MTTTPTNSDDTIDIRDVIARVEELQSMEFTDRDDEDREFASLLALLEECKGNGGDEQWQGDWYPITLVRDSYFEEYAQELAEEIGAIKAGASWPNNCIDWEQAALELYTSVEFDGVTYWVR